MGKAGYHSELTKDGSQLYHELTSDDKIALNGMLTKYVQGVHNPEVFLDRVDAVLRDLNIKATLTQMGAFIVHVGKFSMPEAMEAYQRNESDYTHLFPVEQ